MCKTAFWTNTYYPKRFVDEGLKIFTGNPFFDIVFKYFFMFFPICSVCMLCVLSMKHN